MVGFRCVGWRLYGCGVWRLGAMCFVCHVCVWGIGGVGCVRLVCGVRAMGAFSCVGHRLGRGVDGLCGVLLGEGSLIGGGCPVCL